MTVRPNCEDCGVRPGVIEWHVDMMAFTHGGEATMLCKLCAKMRELNAACQAAVSIPHLVREYDALVREELETLSSRNAEAIARVQEQLDEVRALARPALGES